MTPADMPHTAFLTDDTRTVPKWPMSGFVFRWKLGTDYDPEMDVYNAEQYRKCPEYLERERLRRSPPPVKTLTPKPKPRDFANSSSALPTKPVDATLLQT